jgi:hypothetical protein
MAADCRSRGSQQLGDMNDQRNISRFNSSPRHSNQFSERVLAESEALLSILSRAWICGRHP